MTQPDRIYLDNAATSWPKPDSVYAAVDHYQRKLGGPAGRSFYREAAEVERKIAQEFIERHQQSLNRLAGADGQLLDARAALSRFCRVLMNLNEFVYID